MDPADREDATVHSSNAPKDAEVAEASTAPAEGVDSNDVSQAELATVVAASREDSMTSALPEDKVEGVKTLHLQEDGTGNEPATQTTDDTATALTSQTEALAGAAQAHLAAVQQRPPIFEHSAADIVSKTDNMALLTPVVDDDSAPSGDANEPKANAPNGEWSVPEGESVDADVEMADVSATTATEAPDGAPASRLSRKRAAPKRLEDELAPSPPPTTKSLKTESKGAGKPSEEATAAVNANENTAEDDITMEGEEDAKQTPSSSAAGEAQPTPKSAPPKRTTRRRGAAKNYNEDDDDEADFEPSSRPKARKSTSQPKRGGPRGNWTPDFLLQDPKSKLAKADVTAILKDPRAWSSLKPEQQSTIISLLPTAPALNPDPENPNAPLPNIPQQVLSCNSAFRADIALFQEDLAEGRLDPSWQHDAMVAMEKRARGEFDAWKEAEMEAFWGQKQKLSYDVLAGESSKVKLETLVAAGCFEVGDVWTYTRSFGKGKNNVKIEKEATITSITTDNRLVFRMPPGTAKFSSQAAGEDIQTKPISGPQSLADTVIQTDGRIKEWRGVNAWKEIRCARKNQDIGTPWEIREVYWASNEAGPQ